MTIKILLALVAAAGLSSASIGAEQTWTGKISDSACGAKHTEAAEGEGKMPDPECTQACIRGGSLYVLVADSKVYEIANQKDPAVIAQAGQRVKVSGELTDKKITVSRIERIP